MRIISKFKDYYDSSIGYGIDPLVVYKRFDQRYELQRLSWRLRGSDSTEDQIVKDIRKVLPKPDRICGELFSHVYVGFCGKIYTGLAYHVGSDPDVPVRATTYWDGLMRHYETRWQYAWSERDVPAAELTQSRVEKFSRGFMQCESMQEWFERNDSARTIANTDVFTKYGIVSFVLHDGALITDGPLTQVRFQRVMDNFTAFQEISMFVSGVLGSANDVEPEPITDELRAQTKGFDKRSFRKDPTKKKRG